MTHHLPHALIVITALCAGMTLDALPVVAQRAPTSQKTPPAAPQSATEPPAPAPEAVPAKPENSGLINEIGKLFGKPGDLFPSLKLTPDVAAPASPPLPSGDTSTTITPVAPAVVAAPTPQPPVAPPASPRIPKMVTGRSSCPVAANGAPDCKIGADSLCKTKGFTSGSSLDMDSMHNCSKDALLAGARSIKDICRTETFVTRAMCQ